MNDIKQLSRIIEGALFAANRPLSFNDLLQLFEENDRPEKQMVREAIDALMQIYEDRGIELKDLASGFQFQVKSDLSPWVQRLWEEKPARYSRALLETLALIAYRQPITRGEISDVRGVVVSSNIIRTLMEREWIHVVGFRDVPGKPGLYATTKKFLDDLGLKSLKELPELPDAKALEALGGDLQEKLGLTDESEEETILTEILEEEITLTEMPEDDMMTDEEIVRSVQPVDVESE